MPEQERRIVVVGGSAAGLRCACRLARLRPNWSVTVVEAREVFSYAACGLPYALSGDIGDAAELRRTDAGLIRDEGYFAGHKGVRVLAGHRAERLDAEGRILHVSGPGGAGDLAYDELVLATGASASRLPGQPDHPRVRAFHSWEDLNHFHGMLSRGEVGNVALIGAGLVGCELAEAFTSLWGCETSLLEAASSVLPGVLDPELAACVEQHLRGNDVAVRTSAAVERIEAGDEGVVVHAGGEPVRADIAVVAVGVEPAADLALSAGAEIGSTGGIVVDERFATTVAHLWAVGDCVEVHHAVTGNPALVPLGSLANRQGRTLANVLAGRDDRFPPVVGATALKAFDWNVAATGCTAARAEAAGLDARSVWISAYDRPHYWPEAPQIHLALVYDPDSRRVLGVQGAGTGEVAKRIDVATQLISRRATLDEFSHLEHAYAPPYAPALDPLAVAAFAAQNQEDGVVSTGPLDRLEGATILDVRLPDEVERAPATLPPAGTVPQGEIRDRRAEIDRATDLAICERGTRSAEAVRILERLGIRARYLGGGLQWRAAAGKEDRS
jgi:NADPH-dependent 2,4-dienoyl-CoA reductase/sulfur reductase-like enzyme/rhodanese-related sulfurtransferase